MVSLNGVRLLAGGVMLYLGAEWLVGGASRLALSLRVPQLIVGLTVVAYGTSAPEAVVGIEAALGGHGQVALGNVIGSNIANIGLILGLSALMHPARVDGALARRELPMLLISAIAPPLVLFDGHVARWEAGALLAVALLYTGVMVATARKKAILDEAAARAEVSAEAADAGGAPSAGGRLRQALTALVGLGILLLGGQVFVQAATELARGWGMSERVVGLTIVAVGTSLPELATSLIAAARGHSDIAVGNVIGSNIFNVFLCLGVAALAGPVASRPAALAADLGALGAMTLLALVFLRTERTLQRWEGGLLLALYVGFLGYLAR